MVSLQLATPATRATRMACVNRILVYSLRASLRDYRQFRVQPAEENSFFISEASGVNYSSLPLAHLATILSTYPAVDRQAFAKPDQLHRAGELELCVSVHLHPPSPPPIKGGNPLEQKGKKRPFCCWVGPEALRPPIRWKNSHYIL
jgi:hypothetical protein